MANYSDYDLRMATQIAYIDGLDASVRAHPDWTLKEHFENNPGFAKTYIEKNGTDLYNELMNGKYADWKFVNDPHAIENTNSETGFYACAIDTGDGNMIVAYRGSESMDWTQKKNDWLIADAGILNSVETKQQEQAREYLDYIVKNHPEYNSVSVTGHSLGGNLAEHATVTASDEVYDRIDRTLNLDGPGFSDEYIRLHSKDIDKHAGKIDHYQYSLVGAILNRLPGTNYKYVLASERKGLFLKHGTENIRYDENGNMIETEPDDLSAAIYSLTNAIDDNTNMPGLLSLLEIVIMWKTPLWKEKFIGDICKYLYKHYDNIRKQNEARKTDIDFKVNKSCLSFAEESFVNCQRGLNTYADEVRNIKNSISLLIKVGAIFSVGVKMNLSTYNLEKMSAYSQKMGSSAAAALEAFQNYEGTITANAEQI